MSREAAHVWRPTRGPRAGLPILALTFALATAVVAPGGFALPVIDVYGGFDGFYRPGEWAPVVVTVNNQPSETQKASGLEDFEGVLSIPSESVSDPPAKYLFTRTIEVPSYSIQRFFLYAKFPENPLAPVLELRTRNGRLLGSYPLNIQPLAPGNVLLLTVSKELTPIRLPPLPGVDPVMRSNSPPERLPEQWWGYESVGALVLTTWSETYLRPAQEEALEQWLKSGGTLVVLAGGDPAAWKGGLMDRVLPGNVTESERIRLNPDGGAALVADTSEAPGENDFVAARLQPGLDAQILAELEGLPLMVRSRFGKGTVLFFALDFQSLPDTATRLFTPLWRAVVPYDPITGTRATWRTDMRNSTQVVSRRAARPPNIFLIFLLLVGYVVAVGPLNFRFLSKRKKVEWAWFTVPAIVLLFSLLIYGIGALTKGGQLIVREASLVIGEADESAATLDGLIGIFSPEKRRYSALPETPTLAVGESDDWSQQARDLRRSYSAFQPAAVGRQSAGGLLGFAESRTTIRMEDDLQVLSELPLGQWDLGFIESYGLVNLEGSISADLTYDGTQVAGTIRNNTARTLRSPVLYSCGYAYPLPRDLLPGDTFTLEKGKAQFPEGEIRLGWGHPQDVIERQVIEKQSFGSEDALLAARTRCNLAYFQLYPELTSRLFAPRGGETWLFAFDDESAAPVELNSNPNVFTHSVCYAFRLSLTPAKGTLTIPAAQTHVELLHHSIDGEVYFIDEGDLEMFDSTCVASATLPFESLRAQVATIQVGAILDPGTNQEFVFEILDQQTSRWIEIPYENSDNQSRLYSFTRRGDSSRFVTPLTGRLFLRMTSRRSQAPTISFSRHSSTLKRLNVAYTVTVP